LSSVCAQSLSSASSAARISSKLSEAKKRVIWGRFCSILASGGVVAKVPIGPWTRCGVLAMRSILWGSAAGAP
jgi:hypothetical protein